MPILKGRGAPVGLSSEDFAIWYERRRRFRLSWWQDVQLLRSRGDAMRATGC